MKLDQNMIRVVSVVLLFLVLSGTGAGFKLMSSQGYVSGYEGAKASFSGVKYEGKMTETMFRTTLDFDPDDPNEGMPNLAGEMSNVFVPRQSLGPSWIPADWQRQAFEDIRNPVREPYEWSIPDTKTNTTYAYRMEEWKLKWYVSVGAQWSRDWTQVPWWTPSYNAEYRNKVYSNTEIWFKLDLTPIWYFEGQTTAYFAIAKITLSDIAFGGRLNTGETKEGKQAAEIKVNPESDGSYLTLYYGLGGTTGKPEVAAYEYQGKKLNPNLFTDHVYTYVSLNNFGTRWEMDWLGNQYATGDVVTFGFNVHVFVIGEWQVKDIQDLKDYEDYGKTSQYGEEGVFLGLSALLNSPEGRLLLLLIGAVIVLLILAIFAPGVLLLLFSLSRSFGGGRRKR